MPTTCSTSKPNTKVWIPLIWLMLSFLVSTVTLPYWEDIFQVRKYFHHLSCIDGHLRKSELLRQKKWWTCWGSSCITLQWFLPWQTKYTEHFCLFALSIKDSKSFFSDGMVTFTNQCYTFPIQNFILLSICP
jgi:uncharacterized membrane protein YcfT